jgi:NAD(P)-dependent dehydrogenase (short-subunit alcohol dehydrogenase family)
VYGAARRTEKLQELAAQGVRAITMDVTEEASVVACVNTVVQKEGGIDVLVNCAGYGSHGAVEDVPSDEAHRQLEVNLFGLARMIQLVLPGMRQNHCGKIVNMSSTAGKTAFPFGGWYHASKFAVEGLSDSLRIEVAPFGIDVIIMEPGGIHTNWGAIAAEHLAHFSGDGAYREKALRVADYLSQSYGGDKLSPPELIADTIVKAVTSPKPKTRYLVGYGAKPTMLMRNLFSDRLFDRVAKKMMGLKF